jgi:hypothetical protein
MLERGARRVLRARRHRVDRAVALKLPERFAAIEFRHVDANERAAADRRLADFSGDLTRAVF